MGHCLGPRDHHFRFRHTRLGNFTEFQLNLIIFNFGGRGAFWRGGVVCLSVGLSSAGIFGFEFVLGMFSGMT